MASKKKTPPSSFISPPAWYATVPFQGELKTQVYQSSWWCYRIAAVLLDWGRPLSRPMGSSMTMIWSSVHSTRPDWPRRTTSQPKIRWGLPGEWTRKKNVKLMFLFFYFLFLFSSRQRGEKKGKWWVEFQGSMGEKNLGLHVQRPR